MRRVRLRPTIKIVGPIESRGQSRNAHGHHAKGGLKAVLNRDTPGAGLPGEPAACPGRQSPALFYAVFPIYFTTESSFRFSIYIWRSPLFSSTSPLTRTS